MYILTDKNYFLGKDSTGRATIYTSQSRATEFKTELAAVNYIKCLPEMLRKYNWFVCNTDADEDPGELFLEYPASVLEKTARSVKATPMEDDEFDICTFFTEVVNVMSSIDKFIANMVGNEQRVDMKILDIRHYIRDNNHKLNAIQMQRLGYYLQELERERYEYKSKRIIASMFAHDIGALKDKTSIIKMNDVLNSKYRPKVLDDNDIEYIINKKKDDIFPAEAV